ncbi:hypothetical protein GGX14DRAFT_602299 [Mycena pura]|uniref:White collar 2 protein n=1 Tax=Mycena pura TaxID=153505 RepID=A0AAD6VUW7_9AGAR|nr:hypothetical protein GGX14DRAFT_602299 [Mycena pura]
MASPAEAGTATFLPLSNSVPNFEFGKRKRWADLVITEQLDVLLLVLSPQGKILYCGNGLKNLLGWKDADLVDSDITDLLNAEDKDTFMQAFEGSLRSGNPLPPSFVRMKCAESSLSDPQAGELVLEINGRTQLVEAEDSADLPMQVFFAVAKPHPNKALETLNTFIELQEEHERLQQRVAELRARAPRSTPTSPASSAGSSQTSMYATTSMVTKPPISHSPQATYSPIPAEDISPSPASSGGPFDNPGTATSGNEDDDLMRKKKPVPKKAAPAEQYVCITCGRTDSPEWRKGPLGPKTLCNACGLRWAKQAKVQKLSEEASAAA